MARKVFISVLGTGRYNPCVYNKEAFRSTNTRFVQQAVMEHIGIGEWSKDDCAYILLTDKARKQNWENRVDAQTNAPVIGLKQVIDEMNVPCEVKDVSICDGKDETEMWEIFQTLYGFILEEDELYIDLTHGFRYLPMLVLVFGNYAKFLKQISIKYLSYGNFEASVKREEVIYSPLVDLLPLSQLQDWTFASADFLKNGDASTLRKLCNGAVSSLIQTTQGKDDQEILKDMNKFVNALDDLTESMRLCRGKKIHGSDKWGFLQKMGEKVKASVIPPMAPLVGKIQGAFSSFSSSEDITNGYHAFIWCYEHQLYQQAITILLETMISDFSIKYGLNWQNLPERDLVSGAINSLNPQKNKKSDKEKNTSSVSIGFQEIVECLKTDPFFHDVCDLYWSLNTLRNDINHGGELDSSTEHNARIKNRLNDYVKTVEKKLIK